MRMRPERSRRRRTPLPKLFALVVNALYALDTSDAPPGTVLCYYLQRLLKIEGLYPSLDVHALSVARRENIGLDRGFRQ